MDAIIQRLHKLQQSSSFTLDDLAPIRDDILSGDNETHISFVLLYKHLEVGGLVKNVKRATS